MTRDQMLATTLEASAIFCQARRTNDASAMVQARDMLTKMSDGWAAETGGPDLDRGHPLEDVLMLSSLLVGEIRRELGANG